jgi:hypothetical protein
MAIRLVATRPKGEATNARASSPTASISSPTMSSSSIRLSLTRTWKLSHTPSISRRRPGKPAICRRADSAAAPCEFWTVASIFSKSMPVPRAPTRIEFSRARNEAA